MIHNILLRETDLLYTVGDMAGLLKVCSSKIPQIAFSGRSNVGKSTIINSIIGRKSLARISQKPGKTITINFYGVPAEKKSSTALYLVDLPGYGYAKREATGQARFSELTNSYFEEMSENITLVVQLVDMGVGITKDDQLMLEWLKAKKIQYIVVATKSDKLNKTEYNNAKTALQTNPAIIEGTKIIPFSAKTKEGIGNTVNTLLNILKK